MNFTFIVNDGQADSEPAEVTIDITPVNDAPVANPQAITTLAGVPTVITLSGSDVDGDALTFNINTPPNHGALSGTAPNLMYLSAAGYLCEDEFSFIVNDGELDSAPVTVSITISPDIIFAPVIYR